jgi:peptidyl-prolyl cis-trans isomerase C
MKLRHIVSIVAVAGSLVSGCASRESDPVLATVGDEKITLATYREAYQSMSGEKPDLSDPEKRRTFLQDLINKTLMEKEALSRQPELDEGMRRRLHRFAESQLLSVLQKKEILDKANVTDQDVKAAYQRMGEERKAKHILVGTEEEIREIHAELNKGKSFDELARSRSMDQSNASQGGDLGWVEPSQMVGSFDQALWALEKGQVSEPVQSPFGWHLILLEDIRTVEKEPFDAVKDKLKTQIQQQRVADIQDKFIKSVNNDASPENQLAAIELINKKFAFELPPEQANDPYAIFNAQRDLPAFSAEELRMPVVMFADRPPLTIKGFNELLVWMPPGVWPKGGGPAEVEELIRQMLRTKLYKERAMKLGYHKLPEYVAAIKKKEREMRVNMLYFQGIVQNVQLTDSELRDYFQSHRENYRLAERSSQLRVDTSDSAVAVLAAKMWRSGSDLVSIEQEVKKIDPGAQVLTKPIDVPRTAEPELDELVYAARPNDVIGPVYLPKPWDSSGGYQYPRWAVVQVLKTEPERFMTFEEAQAAVADHAKAFVADERLKELLVELQKKFTVTVNDEALKAITPESLNPAPAGSTT